MTSDEDVTALAQSAGLEVRWTDANGKKQTVGIETLRAVLAALELPAKTPRDISESRARLDQEKTHASTLVFARPGTAAFLEETRRAEIENERGERKPLALRKTGSDGAMFRAPREPGYYRIATAHRHIGLVVAPSRALSPRDLLPGRQAAGISVQVYALRGGTSGAYGDFAALGSFAAQAGRAGFDAVMASPMHALSGADASRFSPYSPSTRLFFNPLFADATLEGGPTLPAPDTETLIDWRSASQKKDEALRAAFAQFRRARDRTRFEAFCRDGGERLLAHALFEALDVHFRAQGIRGFRSWPAGFESPAAAKISGFVKSAHRQIEYQLFLQWLCARSAEAAQESARKTMAIGIVSDLAVGMDPQGSHAWSAAGELLYGLHVGAPPDDFSAQGQDWGLTALSPSALRASGYASFIATLRAGTRHAGGIRIDHALGLRRLWVLPAGASPSDGVYLRYPEEALLRLIALESHRNRAVVVGEDLGTVPEGFRDELVGAGILGTQVLWFERNGRGGFVHPSAWRREAMATTTTHDLATLAGWWSGHDIEWRKSAGHLHQSEEIEQSTRASDRRELWSALKRARCANGKIPPVDKPDAAVLGALKFVGRTRCTIAFAPVEDFAADPEQPNVPGTIDEHPNWRRRMKKGDFFRDTNVRRRMHAFLSARRNS